MEKPLLTLNDHLDAWYSADVRKIGGNPTSIVEHFQSLMADTPALKDEAEQRLNSMRGVDDGRCFITRNQRVFLQKVLNIKGGN